MQSYLLQYATKIKPLPKHILFYHLGVSNDQMPRWIWNLEAYILSAAFLWKLETRTLIIFLCILYRWFTRWKFCSLCYTFPPSEAVMFMQLPDSIFIFTTEIWTKLKNLLQPNTLFVLQTHFRVSMLYSI